MVERRPVLGQSMRKELKKLEGQRDLFVGTFVREGLKTAFKGAPLLTLLLKDVKRVSDQKLMCDHLWLNKTKALTALRLSTGEQVQFAARVAQYSKGYLGRKDVPNKNVTQDFKLSRPTQVTVLSSTTKDTESNVIIRKAKRNS